jgi:zinc D-Ala-D-Ala carboxypeptidase
MDWSKYPNFTEAEFTCKHTGKCHMDDSFMDRLQALRIECGFPFKVTSGYRDPSHPIEKAKNAPGEHSTGKAADIAVSGEQAYKLLSLAPKYGFIRIGIQQKGSGRYIHLGTSIEFPSPRVWSY